MPLDNLMAIDRPFNGNLKSKAKDNRTVIEQQSKGSRMTTKWQSNIYQIAIKRQIANGNKTAIQRHFSGNHMAIEWQTNNE